MGLFDFLKRRGSQPSPEPPAARPAALEPHVRAALDAMQRPFVRVTFDDELLQLLPTVSKCGGVPYFPVGTPVPPEPLLFLAQINFAEVPPIDGMPLPRTGILQFWITDDDTWGLYGPDGKERTDSHRCIYYPSIDAPQAPKVPSYERRGPLATGPNGQRWRFELRREPIATTDVAWQSFEYRELLGDDNDNDNANDELMGHKIGGYCDFTQWDPREANDPMLSLLQLGEQGMGGWGDAGVAHWFIREPDLRGANFSNVLFYWDCC